MTEAKSKEGASGAGASGRKKSWSYDKKEVRIDSALKDKLDIMAARKGVYAYEPVEVGLEWALSLMEGLPDGAGEGSVRELAKAHTAGSRLKNVPDRYQPLIQGILGFIADTPRRSTIEKRLYAQTISALYHLVGLQLPDEYKY